MYKRQVRVVGGGDAHVGAVLQQGQQDVNDHVPAADHTDLTSIGKDKEQNQHSGDGHVDRREQKAREGKWYGGFAPYGYRLEKGELLIAEDEVDVI